MSTIKKGNIFIKDVPGVDTSLAQTLSAAGIQTVKDLQNACSNPQALASLAAKTGIQPNKLKGLLPI